MRETTARVRSDQASSSSALYEGQRLSRTRRLQEIAWAIWNNRDFSRVSLAIPERRAVLVLGDLLLVNGASVLSLILAGGLGKALWPPPPDSVLSYVAWLAFLSMLWAFVAQITECYDLLGTVKLPVAARRIFLALLQMGVVYIVLFYLIQLSFVRSIVLLVFFPVALAFLVLWRLTFFTIFRRALFKHRVLIVGAGWAGQTIARELLSRLNGEYALLGFIDDDPEKLGHEIDGVYVLGGRSDLLQVSRELGVHELIMSITHEIHDELYEALIEAQESGLRVTPMAMTYESLTGRVPVQHINDRWYGGFLLTSSPNGLYLAGRRATDIAVGLLGLAVTALLLPLIAVAIRLDSPGSIFYLQERVGLNGQVFKLIKFRSMFEDAEEEGKAIWAVEKDARVTGVGRLLRLTRMDELPQFLNILRGELSLIGPRPERPVFVQQLQKQIPFYRGRLLVKPGLSGWAQVKFGYGNTTESALIKLQYDLYYIKHRSFLMDLAIVFKTFWVVVSCKGT